MEGVVSEPFGVGTLRRSEPSTFGTLCDGQLVTRLGSGRGGAPVTEECLC